MERSISFWGYKEQETHLILHEEDNYDDDDDKIDNIFFADPKKVQEDIYINP